MKAIIPVAGVGERLRPFTHTTPKPLLSLAGKPILAHIIDWLIEQGVSELVLVVGYMGDQIEDFVEECYDLPVNIVYQEKLSGLGYAIYLALKHISSEPFLVVLGDTRSRSKQYY
jgi:glucose-1-phosphate thymidylyltransferase